MTDLNDVNTVIGDDKTKLTSTSSMPRISARQADKQEYTQFTHSQNTSSGFAEAHSIALQAQAGSLLKKRFLLESVLGQGGMGTVYKTKDLRKVEAEDPYPYIATKVLSEVFKGHPNAFVALQQETAKSQTLAHPNIVTVHDFDRDGDVLYMTMELLEGEPLDCVINAHRHKGVEKVKALAIVRDLCAALAYAHQRHIIHADFKPGNVFVCRDGTAKVLDFGIARAASKETQKHKFDAGQLGAYTPAYATIEMVNDEALTFTDDVYALACVAYELLTGRHPYNNKSAAEAKVLGLKLRPVDTINHKQFKALAHGLALEKNKRTATVAEFSKELFPRRIPTALVLSRIALSIALCGVAWFAYSQQQEKLKLQQMVSENIEQAQTCFALSDFACALERSLVASNLDENNKVAVGLVSAAQLALKSQEDAQKITHLLDSGDACLLARDSACAQVKAKEVLAVDGNNVRAQQLLLSANSAMQDNLVDDYVNQAEQCLRVNDFTCAETFLKKSTDINAYHPSINVLQNKLDSMRQKLKITEVAQQQKVAAQVQVAQLCLSQKKYDCAIQEANAALLMDTANAQAMEIKQKASVADQRRQEEEARVNKIIEQAKICLEKQKNYSCAIAKAEAALDLMPNNSAALAIKARAQDIQRKIKETGFTIK